MKRNRQPDNARMQEFRVSQRREILAFQGGCCPICETQLEDGHLDHDHSCQRHSPQKLGGGTVYMMLMERCPCVRGVLCRVCNTVILASLDSGLVLPGPEVKRYLDNPPAQAYFRSLVEVA